MMRSRILLLAICTSSAFAIDCYICSTLHNPSCGLPTPNLVPLRTCDLGQLRNTTNLAAEIETEFRRLFELDNVQEPRLPLNCLKQVSKVDGRRVVLRGCQLAADADQLDICVKVKKEMVGRAQTEYCSLCDGNGCNGSDALQSGKVVLMMVSAFLFGV